MVPATAPAGRLPPGVERSITPVKRLPYVTDQGLASAIGFHKFYRRVQRRKKDASVPRKSYNLFLP